MKSAFNQPQGPSAEQWQAYLENRLSPEERARVEAMLEASEDDREALEGLKALGPEATSALVAGLHRDIDIMTAPGREKRGAGLVRRLGYVRMGVAAAVLVLFGAGFWMLSVVQQQKADRQAFERHFEPIAPRQLGEASGQTEGGAYTEQLKPGQGQNTTAQGTTGGASPMIKQDSKPLDMRSVQESEDQSGYQNFSDAGSDGSREDLAPAPQMADDSEFPAVSGANQSQPALADAVVPETSQEEKNAVPAGRTEVSGQQATKSLELLDNRKQENPLSQRSSRQKEAPVAGAAEPAAAPATESDGLVQIKGSRDDGDFSTESDARETLSLSEVAISPTSKPGYKAAPDPYEQGQSAYSAGDYRMATEWLSKVPDGHPQTHAADLLEANAWLERDRPEKAIPLLEGLKALGPGPLYDQSRWYLALAHLAQGNEDPATALLEVLIMENGPYRARALELLSDLGD